MVKMPVKALTIIEVPYDETKPMWKVYFKEEKGVKEAIIESYITHPNGWRELDDYKICGVYNKANVPIDIFQVNSVDKNNPHEEQVRNISKLTEKSIREGKCVVMTGGGCSHTIGMVGGLQQALGKDIKIGFIWLDAHGDINTPESTESGLVGGTPLATIAGLCHGKAYNSWMKAAGIDYPLRHNEIILSDGRDLDPKEAELLKSTEIIYLNTTDFNNLDTWKETVNNLADRVDVIYLHIDGDILDERFTPGQYTARSGGSDVETVMNNIKTVMNTDKVIAFSLVSIFHENDNPCKELCNLNGIRLLGAGFERWRYCPVI